MQKLLSRRIPKRYVVLISCTGKAPITFSFHPLIVLSTVVTAIAIPTTWVGNIIYSYAQHNASLLERNHSLAEEATNILERVQILEGEIRTLQERAGMSPGESSSENTESLRAQGGIGASVEPELLLETANNQLPNLFADLKSEVQPALEKTLEREDARPQGMPLKGQVRKTSEFGVRRNPFGRGFEFHQGQDFAAPYGSPIHATAPGVVIRAELSGGFGNHVVIDHGYGYKTLYAHLSSIAVTQGEKVERDRVVGFLGNTGRSSGPHLHYSVYRNGQATDPKDYLD